MGSVASIGFAKVEGSYVLSLHVTSNLQPMGVAVVEPGGAAKGLTKTVFTELYAAAIIVPPISLFETIFGGTLNVTESVVSETPGKAKVTAVFF